MALLKHLEGQKRGERVPLNDVLDELPYNDQGLIAAIAQDDDSDRVLMLGWMNRTAIERSLAEGCAVYYSRSRQAYWRKGETSGHTQKLVSMAFDCDGDALLLRVNQEGPACHTNRPTCFYLQVEGDAVVINADITIHQDG